MDGKMGISISNLIEESFKALIQNWKELLKLVGLLVAGLLGFYFIMIVGILIESEILIVAITVVGMIPLVLFSLTINSAAIKIFAEWKQGRFISWKDALKVGWSKKWSLLGSSLLQGLIIIVPMMIFVGIMIAVGINVPDEGAIMLIMIICTILMYFIILVLAMVISIAFIFTPISITIKDSKAIEGMKDSIKFYKGKFGAILGRMLLIGLISFAIMSAIQVPLFIFMIIPIVNIIFLIILMPIAMFVSYFTIAGNVIIFLSYDKSFQISDEIINVE